MIKIALLDPHPFVHKGFKAFFRKSERICVLNTFSRAKDLYSFLEKKSIDALILEMELEEDSAFEIIKTIKEKHSKTAIIIYTALPQKIYGISFLKAGAAGYLSKKVSKKVLIEGIYKVVGNGYHITSNFADDISNNVNFLKPKNLYRALSPREYEVFKMLIEGKRNFEISSTLNLNPKTINTYKTRLMRKLDVENPIDLFQQAKNFNLV
ncbi:MAG: response regulator transcription factor [Flavobacteriaceae bacterium]|nr:response regulator transcription factor [Flavobacteriaceae bacterium]